MSWITVRSGRSVNLLDPWPEDFDIHDIAFSLSNLCRYTGHVEFYSVAEHCIHVSRECDPQDALAGLLHDASEAYVNDLSSPLKGTFELEGYRGVEARIQHVLADAFGTAWPIPPSVHRADRAIAGLEARALISPTPEWSLQTPAVRGDHSICGFSPREARAMFLNRYHELVAARNATIKH